LGKGRISQIKYFFGSILGDLSSLSAAQGIVAKPPRSLLTNPSDG